MKLHVLLSLVAAFTVTTFGIIQTQAEKQNSQTPRVMAVKFHADWCKSCKAIGPSLESLGDAFSSKPVLFVTLDLTDDASKRQAEYLASALGIGTVFQSHAPKTGYVLLIDSKSGRVVGKLTKKDTVQAMSAAVDKALRRAG